ncbi:MAG TPA: cytochrome c oxidase assembly protein [Gammaproteobacteria bacterium]
MRRAASAAGLAALAGAWLGAVVGHGLTVHMLAHMTAVAVAAPLLAVGFAGTAADPAARWPRVVTPLPMSIAELVVVWGWHVPAARALASGSLTGLALEQAAFAAAGLLLWSACLGTGAGAASGRRAAGVAALLLTTMHMTLLGVLIALAPRPLFGAHPVTSLGLTALEDQQLAGVVMLLVGGGGYLVGALVLLAGLLADRGAEVGRCS